ncbi:hypothetical protein BJV78DRAFT_1257670 [Lactifluus subvellereus]|nr:hypothetical protein BJV78DRAFT_1257670 [Lactifluus subvellereus]
MLSSTSRPPRGAGPGCNLKSAPLPPLARSYPIPLKVPNALYSYASQKEFTALSTRIQTGSRLSQEWGPPHPRPRMWRRRALDNAADHACREKGWRGGGPRRRASPARGRVAERQTEGDEGVHLSLETALRLLAGRVRHEPRAVPGRAVEVR